MLDKTSVSGSYLELIVLFLVVKLNTHIMKKKVLEQEAGTSGFRSLSFSLVLHSIQDLWGISLSDLHEVFYLITVPPLGCGILVQ